MNKIILEIVKNPVKCKLLLEFLNCEQTTAKHLSETFSDIPPATLYRYLKKMTTDGVLKIVYQTQVRGAMEKTYALAIDLKCWTIILVRRICRHLFNICWDLQNSFKHIAKKKKLIYQRISRDFLLCLFIYLMKNWTLLWRVILKLQKSIGIIHRQKTESYILLA